MSWEAWFTLAVVALTVVLLAREVLAPSGVVFGATVVLLVADVIDPAQAFGGFSNPAPITVAALYVVAAGIERTGLLTPVVDAFLGGDGGTRSTLVRLMMPTAGASAFLNNTPIVAMLVPPVTRWSQRNGHPVSRYLMPLSFAAVLGGMITLIGTSTNVVVSGLLEASGRDAMGFFEISKVGLPVAVVGLVFMLVFTPLLLPERRAARRDIEDVREFVVEMTVDAGGPLDGVTVREGELRHLAGVFLAQVERSGRIIAPATPDTVLAGGDVLRFVGNAADVADLHSRRGLSPAVSDLLDGFSTQRLAFYEAVIGSSSPLAGRSLKSAGFRDRYRAAVIAVHRADHRVEGKLGEVRLRNGDTLLLIADASFRTRWHGTPDFLLVSRLGSTDPPRSAKALPAAAVGSAVVVVAGVGWLPILESSLVGALLMVGLGVLTPYEARTSVDLNVIVVIASSFGLGSALEATGLADRIADGIVDGLSDAGNVAVLLGVVLATVALTELITNNAAAILMFPIAVSAAVSVGGDPRGYAIAVALAASASFLTPIGYQTNTMVWGPGGYRFGDYARVGFPLTLVAIATIVVLAPVWWTI